MNFILKLPRPRAIFWMIFAGVLIFDQATKLLIQGNLNLHQSRVIIPGFFNLTYVLNDGIAFGLFQGNSLLIGIVAVVILSIGLWWSRNLDWKNTEINVIAGLIVGGALGNLIDRVRMGHVIDFLDIHIRDHFWPSFNVADSCITMSVVYLLIRAWLSKPAQQT